MRILGLNRLLQAAVVATGIVAISNCDALAWSRGSHGSYGSYSSGSYSSGSSGSYSSGSYSSGSSGSHGGLFARWHARKAAKHSHGSYGSYSSGSYSSGSYSSGSSASYGSYGSHGSSASYGTYYAAPVHAAPTYEVPVESAAPAMPGETGAPALPPSEPPAPPQASIRVKVPADATVFVNDRPTTSTGESRHYISRGLQAGRTYAYQLRVEFERNGEKIVENKLIRLQAGQTVEQTFGQGEQVAEEKSSKPATKLTLHVPAEAKVSLAGAATKQTGEERTYVSSHLAPGQKWDGYVVRVELEREGENLVKEKTLSIVGGEAYELSFDFADEPTTIASVN